MQQSDGSTISTLLGSFTATFSVFVMGTLYARFPALWDNNGGSFRLNTKVNIHNIFI